VGHDEQCSGAANGRANAFRAALAARLCGREIGAVIASNPPYALRPLAFRFAALATLAGRAPIGGQREVALAAYVAARLVDDATAGRELPPPIRIERAATARNWLSSLTPLPPSVRTPLARLVDSTAGDAAGMKAALQGVITVTAPYLDAAARSELDSLAAALDADPAAG